MSLKNRVDLLQRKIENMPGEFSEPFPSPEAIETMTDEEINKWSDYILTRDFKQNNIKTLEQAFAYYKSNHADELNDNYESAYDVLKEYFENHK